MRIKRQDTRIKKYSVINVWGLRFFYFSRLLVKNAINEYIIATIKTLNTKLISVSLTECDRLSMSIKR